MSVEKAHKVTAEVLPEKVAGTFAISTTGKREVVLGFNVREMILDGQGSGHIVFSTKQARRFLNLFAKHIDIAEKERP